MTRRSVVFSGPGEISIEESDVPTPGRGEVLVETVASAISPGTEMLIYRDQWPADTPIDATIESLAGAFSYPLKYGYAAVGRVIAVGSDVEDSWLDRLVFAFQPHESHFTARVESLLPAPTGITAESAVFLPNMETAVNLVHDGHPLLGENVVIYGQGVVGLLTTALLAKLSLNTLITLDQHTLRRQMSETLGANRQSYAADDQFTPIDS